MRLPQDQGGRLEALATVSSDIVKTTGEDTTTMTNVSSALVSAIAPSM